MDIADYQTSPYVDPLVKELEEYGLMKHVVELEAYGLTVVPPEKMAVADDFADRLRDAIIRTCEKRNGIKIREYKEANPAVESGTGLESAAALRFGLAGTAAEDVTGPGEMGKNSWFLMEEDEVFVEAATNPRVLALVHWLCGQSATLTGHTWIMKPQGSSGIPLHSDAHGIPPGGGHIAHVCNASWLCTDYAGEEDGPSVFVPGSHRFGRATLPHEQNLETTPFKWVPLIGKAGSLAIWHGSTWHASVARTKPGLRVTLVQVFMRRHMRPIHLWDGEISPQLLAKHPALQDVLGLGEHLYPYKESNDDTRVAPFMLTGTDPFA